MNIRVRWRAKEAVDCYETFDTELNRIKGAQTDWLVDLQATREAIDTAYNEGALAEYQWRALVSKSAFIQDQFNGDR